MGLLRLFFALSVLLHHCHFPDTRTATHLDGGVAVLAFFMISGFYMSLVINEKYSMLQYSAINFYLSRILRIYPIYLFVLMSAAILFRSINQPSVLLNWLDLPVATQLFIAFANISLLGQDVFNVLIEDQKNGSPVSGAISKFMSDNGAQAIRSDPVFVLIGQAWSLSLELMFYLIAPFLVIDRKRVFAALIVTLALRAAFNHFGFPSIPYAIRFFPTILPFFLLGSLSYYAFSHIKDHPATAIIGRSALAILVVILAVLIPEQITFLQGGFFDTFSHWAFYIGLMALLPFIFAATKKSKIDAALGEYSYPIYLIHGIIIGYMVEPIRDLQLNGTALVVFWSVLFSWLLIRAIERPIDAFRGSIRIGGTRNLSCNKAPQGSQPTGTHHTE